MKDTHMAWDRGMSIMVINQVLYEGLGLISTYEQKTTKAKCGKRSVPMAQIDNSAPTCKECCIAIVEEEKFAANMEAFAFANSMPNLN